MKIYNSLSRQIEEFEPINPPKIGMYTCGPTVYHYAHIGNFRTYITSDLLLRTLRFLGYQVDFIMNLTDVGHLTGDNLGDADTGEDRMEKSAKREGKTVWDIAQFYTDAFTADFQALNLVKPRVFCKATDHIKEQIELVQKLEEKGFTYKIDDGIYFDTDKFPGYGRLSTLEEIKEGARVEMNPQKRNPRDFALWKFSPAGEKRQMEWKSPWGMGFPGWHIECSAMAMKYLGESFDLHVGGEDLRSTHHPNEIAQSEAVTDKQFVKYWVHGAFILVDGKRMSKSGGNNYRLADIIERGYDPMDLRYLYLTANYREVMNLTFASLDGARSARRRLVDLIASWRESTRHGINEAKAELLEGYNRRFGEALADDLNFPKAVALVWEMSKSMIPDRDKLELLLSWDEVFGLNLGLVQDSGVVQLPDEINKLAQLREEARKIKDWKEADRLRTEIEKKGFAVEDKDGESRIRSK